MSIYKLVCSATNNIYYGKTKNSIETRLSKGHYNCTSSDFVNPTIHLVEKCEIKNMADRELYYINNFPCVNISGKGNETPDRTKYIKKKLIQQKWLIKIRESKKWHCSLCNVSFPTKLRQTVHENGYRHKLKNECYKKYGENWINHYKKDNQQKYNDKSTNKKVI